MKKTLYVVLLAVIAISGCLKQDKPNCSVINSTAPESEVNALKTYLDTNNISAIQDSRGFFYRIDSAASATDSHPTVCSDVQVTYTGTFLNGVGFDSSGVNTPVAFNLSGLLTGWQEAIPLMKRNANMVLYLPPSLAYGAAGSPPVIPGNSYLIFYIKLLDFN